MVKESNHIYSLALFYVSEIGCSMNFLLTLHSSNAECFLAVVITKNTVKFANALYLDQRVVYSYNHPDLFSQGAAFTGSPFFFDLRAKALSMLLLLFSPC